MKFILPRRFPLLPRKKNTDKSDYGHAFVLAGSGGLTGAAELASLSALRSGAGLVTLGTPESLEPFFSRRLIEVMKLGLAQTRQKTLSLSAYPKIMRFLGNRGVGCLAMGPGLSQNKQTSSLIRKLIRTSPIPVVLDADGLNAFKGKAHLLRSHSSTLVLTPHSREFERLFSCPVLPKESDRIKLAKKLSKFYDVVLVLKGPRTLVVQKDRFYVNRTGNPGLAKGGTGDVLTGMIASFICQGLGVFEASAWAVCLHGRAGDLTAKSRGQLAMTASDVINFLPKVFKALE